MSNSIKRSGGGLALQVTKPARSAELVDEDAEGNPTRRAETAVYGVDGNLFVIDRDRVELAHRAEVVASAARDARSIYQGGFATIQIAGNGYQAELPGAAAAGFEEGDRTTVVPAPGLLAIADRGSESSRRADDIASLRRGQISGRSESGASVQ